MYPLQQSLRCISPKLLSQGFCVSSTTSGLWSAQRYASSAANGTQKSQNDNIILNSKSSESHQPKKKTQAELDQELRLKMQGLAGDGGESGVEYEDGQPTSMKRSVRENMFRYI